MASQKELFKLLKSLEKSEKQALALERKKKNKLPNYLVLYDWLESWNGRVEDYNRDSATKAINQKNKLSWKDRTIQTAEGNLYSKVIEILANMKLGKSPISIINLDIASADALKKKGFYNSSLDYWKKATDNAYKYQKYSLIIEIIPRKIDVILLTTYKNRKELVEQAYVELKRASEIIQEEIHYRNINVMLFLQYQESKNPEKIPDALKKDYSELIDKNFPEQGSFFSKYYYHSIQAIWHNLHKNPQAAHQQQRKVVDIWLENKPILKTNGQSYLTQLANLANYAINAKEFKAAKEAISLLKNFSPNNNDEAAEQRQNYLFYKQYLLLNEQNFEEARQLIPDIQELLTKYSEYSECSEEKLALADQKKYVSYKRVNPSRLYNFYYNTLITFIFCNEYEHAQLWLSRLRFLYKKKEPGKDLQQFIRILQLIINYGLSSEQFSESMFDKFYRKPEIRNNLSTFENLILDFFKKITLTSAATERKSKHFRLLLSELKNLDEKDKKVMGYEDILLWVTNNSQY